MEGLLQQSQTARKIIRRSLLCLFIFVYGNLADAQSNDLRVTELPDGVVLYERARNSQQEPSFWDEFAGLFKISYPFSKPAPFNRSVAFLTGVSKYENLQPQLPWVASDVNELRTFLLVSGGFDRVYVALNKIATPALVDRYMMTKLSQELSDQDRLLFYFSGHGASDNGTGYMMFGEAQAGQFDYDTTLSLDRPKAWGRHLKAKHALFLIDSCASGLALTPMSSPTDESEALARTLSGTGSRLILTAGTAAERVYQVEESRKKGYSVFTHAFLEALRTGQADHTNRGVVTAGEAFEQARIAVADFISENGQELSFHPQKAELEVENRNGAFIFLNTTAHKAQLKPDYTNALGVVVPKSVNDTETLLLEQARQAWERVKDTNNRAALQAIANEFGDTPYGKRARVEILLLKDSSPPRPSNPTSSNIPANTPTNYGGVRPPSSNPARAWVTIFANDGNDSGIADVILSKWGVDSNLVHISTSSTDHRVQVGPLSQAEAGTLSEHLRNVGFRDTRVGDVGPTQAELDSRRRALSSVPFPYISPPAGYRVMIKAIDKNDSQIADVILSQWGVNPNFVHISRTDFYVEIGPLSQIEAHNLAERLRKVGFRDTRVQQSY